MWINLAHLVLHTVHFVEWNVSKTPSVRDDVVFSLAALAAWGFVMYFVATSRSVGHLVVIVTRCIKDVVKFSALWIVTMLAFTFVGITVGVIGSCMRLGIEYIEEKRFALIFEDCDEDSVYNATTAGSWCTAKLRSNLTDGTALLRFFGVSAVIIILSGSLVAYVAPAAAASGLPEVMAFLNGTFQGKIFAGWTLIVKFIGCLLAVGSGLPSGPEAPMIHLGAMVGRSISDLDGMMAGLGRYIPAVDRFCDVFRNEKDARDLVTAGTAAGVASAFGAPVGGVLFALEEISSSWTPSLTWKVFWTSMLAASMSSILTSLHAVLEDGGSFVGTIQRSSIEFYQPEVRAMPVQTPPALGKPA